MYTIVFSVVASWFMNNKWIFSFAFQIFHLDCERYCSSEIENDDFRNERNSKYKTHSICSIRLDYRLKFIAHRSLECKLKKMLDPIAAHLMNSFQAIVLNASRSPDYWFQCNCDITANDDPNFISDFCGKFQILCTTNSSLIHSTHCASPGFTVNKIKKNVHQNIVKKESKSQWMMDTYIIPCSIITEVTITSESRVFANFGNFQSSKKTR